MKYVVDDTWDLGDVSRYLRAPLDASYRYIVTTPGRAVLLLLAASPESVADVFAAAGQSLRKNNLLSSNGLTGHLVRTIKGSTATIHPYYDGVVGVFSHDSGFRRSSQAIRRTACHEAMHMARFIAQRTLGAKYHNPVLTPELEEATADWTGRLAQEFLDTLHLLEK